MKYLKLLSFTSVLPLLVSCANNGYAGEYVFQMGKSKGTHMGVSLKLFETYYDDTNKDKGKNFELNLDLNMAKSDPTSETSITSLTNLFDGTSEETTSLTSETTSTNTSEDSGSGEGDDSDIDIMDFISEFNPIKGYYKVNEDEKIYDETRLNIGVSILGEFEIPQTITDLIFVANISANYVNFFLPVSSSDLIFQLYWYGYDLGILDLSDPKAINTPEGPHPVGSHPTEEDIKQINTHFKDEHDGLIYRDYHVLKLGLTKK